MDNKRVGKVVLLAGIIIAVMSFIFDYTLRRSVSEISLIVSLQFWIGLLISISIIYAGFFVMWQKDEIISPVSEEIVVSQPVTIEPEVKKKEYDFSNLNEDETRALKIVIKKKSIMQKDLMEELGVNKVKMTRILHKLEGNDMIVRERHGMNNVVVLRE